MNSESNESNDESSLTEANLPQKKFYRQRAHSNPLSNLKILSFNFDF